MTGVIFDVKANTLDIKARCANANASDRNWKWMENSVLGHEQRHNSWCLAIDTNLEWVAILFGVKVSTTQQFTSGLEGDGSSVMSDERQDAPEVSAQKWRGGYWVPVVGAYWGMWTWFWLLIYWHCSCICGNACIATCKDWHNGYGWDCVWLDWLRQGLIQ